MRVQDAAEHSPPHSTFLPQNLDVSETAPYEYFIASFIQSGESSSYMDTPSPKLAGQWSTLESTQKFVAMLKKMDSLDNKLLSLLQYSTV